MAGPNSQSGMIEIKFTRELDIHCGRCGVESQVPCDHIEQMILDGSDADGLWDMMLQNDGNPIEGEFSIYVKSVVLAHLRIVPRKPAVATAKVYLLSKSSTAFLGTIADGDGMAAVRTMISEHINTLGINMRQMMKCPSPTHRRTTDASIANMFLLEDMESKIRQFEYNFTIVHQGMCKGCQIARDNALKGYAGLDDYDAPTARNGGRGGATAMFDRAGTRIPL